MGDEQMLKVSDFGRELYGMSGAPRQAMINYGKVLLAIAGADGTVSPAEYNWLIEHQRKFGAPGDVIAEYENFDHQSANVDELLADIRVDVETWNPAPHLIYHHAIQMCGTDGTYAEAERSKVIRAARALGVPDDVVLTLHALIDMEKAVYGIPRSEGHVAGLPSVLNNGRTSVNHSSSTSGVRARTVSTLRCLGGEPFFAVPNRIRHSP